MADSTSTNAPTVPRPFAGGPRNVGFLRYEVAQLMEQYIWIRDAILGEQKIKKSRQKYLPIPNATDTTAANKTRYDAYVERAVFYNVTQRTLSGLVGQVMAKAPTVNVPDEMQSLLDDATGTGVSLNQQAKRALSLTLAYSRSGVFVDYPVTPPGGATKEQTDAGEFRPTISVYTPYEIINWRVIARGAREVLSLVVLAESYLFADDGFEVKNAQQYRVLKLDENGNYVQEIWKETSPSRYDPGTMPTGKRNNFKNFDSVVVINPLGADGLPLKEIPFQFIGSENNDSSPDDPNMYHLASLNIAHYRNSADYEEACFIVGQPTPVVAGITKLWWDEVLKGTLNFGSRGGIALPENGSAMLLQAAPNTMTKEAMEAKERQMVALGAKLVENQKVQRTAFETGVDSTKETSVLASCAENVSTAFEWALVFAAEWLGLKPTTDGAGGIEFALNTDFDIGKLDSQAQTALVNTWQKGLITFEEAREVLRGSGIATEDNEAAKTAIQKETETSLATQQAFATPPNDPNAPPPNAAKPAGG